MLTYTRILWCDVPVEITGATHVVGELGSKSECEQECERVFTRQGGNSKEKRDEMVCTSTLSRRSRIELVAVLSKRL